MNKQFWKLILPITFQQFMMALVSASDALMLGMLNQEALAAVSLASQVAFVFSLFLAALTIGTSMFAAQFWGKGDKEGIEQVMVFVMRTTAIIAFVFFMGATFFPTVLMEIFTNNPVLIAGGAKYLKVVGSFYLLSGISQIYLCIMKNSGRAAKSMVISTVTVLLNILLNALLIFGLSEQSAIIRLFHALTGMAFTGIPAMGIAGAGIATVISNAVGLVWTVLESYRSNGIRLKMTVSAGRITDLERRFWKYVLPVLGNEIVWGGGFTMYSVVMGHLGTEAVAANAMANIAKNLLICFSLGLGSGGGIMVGNLLGAGRLEEAKAEGGRLCRISLIAGAVTGLLILLLIPFLLRFTNLNPLARDYLKGMLLISSYYMIGKSINSMTIGGIFCAGGDSQFGLLCDTVVLWCITIPLGWISAFVLKLPVLLVYFILNLDEIVKLPAVYRHYKKYNWVRNLTGEEVQ